MAGIHESQLIQETDGSISNKNINQSTDDDHQFQWVFGGGKNDRDEVYDSDFIEEEECSSNDSLLTVSCSESMADDATSSSSHDDDDVEGPLYEFSQLMTHLPLKRGLSKYYEGKSESFGSLANLKGVEDLAKKGGHWSRRSKYRSYGKSQSQTLSPKGRIVKNKSCTSSIARTRSYVVSFLGEKSSLRLFGVGDL